MISELQYCLQTLRNKRPVVLLLTNVVTMEFIVNVLLSIGVSPIVSTYKHEIDDLLNICSSVYINIGTLNDKFIELVDYTIILAKSKSIPIVLDPVGAGASKLRTQYARELLSKVNIIRANASEILALSSDIVNTKGVDSTVNDNSYMTASTELAVNHNMVLAVSGTIDFITNGTDSKEVSFGSQLMSYVTGMGCSVSAVIAGFSVIVPDPLLATYYAMLYFALCGQIASLSNKGVGAFKIAFLDELYKADFIAMYKVIGVK